MKMEEANIVYLPFYAGLKCLLDINNKTEALIKEFWETVEGMSFPEDVRLVMAVGKVHRVSQWDHHAIRDI